MEPTESDQELINVDLTTEKPSPECPKMEQKTSDCQESTPTITTKARTSTPSSRKRPLSRKLLLGKRMKQTSQMDSAQPDNHCVCMSPTKIIAWQTNEANVSDGFCTAGQPLCMHVADQQMSDTNCILMDQGILINDHLWSIPPADDIVDHIHGQGADGDVRIRSDSGDGSLHDRADGQSTGPDEGLPLYGAREVAEFVLCRQRRFLISEVYMHQGECDSGSFLSGLSDPIKANSVPTQYRGEQLHIVTEHLKPNFNHYYALHICTWNSSSCRCGRLENRKSYDLFYRKAVPIKRLSAEDVEVIFNYIVGRSKELVYLEMAGKRGGLRNEVRSLPEVGSERLAAAGMVEACAPPQQVRVPTDGPLPSLSDRVLKGDREPLAGPSNRRSQSERVGGGYGAPSSGDEEAGALLPNIWEKLNQNLRNKKFRSDISDIKNCMLRYLYTPMHGITCFNDWIRYGMDRVNANGMLFDAGLKRYQETINNSDLATLLEIQTGPCARPVYSAGCYKRVKKEYWDIHYSIEMLLVLLKDQFNTVDNVIDFLFTNYEVLEKKTGKKNCICIVGGASTGKNFWADGICDFCLNPGKMENPLRSFQFPFQACHNKRPPTSSGMIANTIDTLIIMF